MSTTTTESTSTSLSLLSGSDIKKIMHSHLSRAKMGIAAWRQTGKNSILTEEKQLIDETRYQTLEALVEDIEACEAQAEKEKAETPIAIAMQPKFIPGQMVWTIIGSKAREVRVSKVIHSLSFEKGKLVENCSIWITYFPKDTDFSPSDIQVCMADLYPTKEALKASF